MTVRRCSTPVFALFSRCFHRAQPASATRLAKASLAMGSMNARLLLPQPSLFAGGTALYSTDPWREIPVFRFGVDPGGAARRTAGAGGPGAWRLVVRRSSVSSSDEHLAAVGPRRWPAIAAAEQGCRLDHTHHHRPRIGPARSGGFGGAVAQVAARRQACRCWRATARPSWACRSMGQAERAARRRAALLHDTGDAFPAVAEPCADAAILPLRAEDTAAGLPSSSAMTIVGSVPATGGDRCRISGSVPDRIGCVGESAECCSPAPAARGVATGSRWAPAGAWWWRTMRTLWVLRPRRWHGTAQGWWAISPVAPPREQQLLALRGSSVR